MDKVIIIDNVIEKKLQDSIEKELLGINFSWFFTPDITNSKKNKNQKRPAFKHFYYNNDVVNSSYFHLIHPLMNTISEKSKIDGKLIQARSFLQLPLNEKFIGTELDTPHIDRETSHTVFLYYVCDSDGDTILYDYIGTKKKDLDKLKITKRIKPKKGRVVIFNGLRWHTAEQPKNNIRCIINFNIDNENYDV